MLPMWTSLAAAGASNVDDPVKEVTPASKVMVTTTGPTPPLSLMSTLDTALSPATELKSRWPASIFDGKVITTVVSSSEASPVAAANSTTRSEEHTSELQSLMRYSYAVFCLKKTIHNSSKYRSRLT